jgi:hypothetical protein
MSEPVDQKGFPRKPRQLSDISWFYEQSDGVWVLQQPSRGVNAISTKIPWRKICSAADRYRKIKAKQRKRR